ncbi:triose-phosphate isomerase [Moraxella oculi]|uniref:Triosephosphate isomerase n=1 Tax=Moraxella oculi TaxID=2940516 RepID=A0ABW8U706_9GAMM
MTKHVIGNWKLNPATTVEAMTLANAIKQMAVETSCHLGCAPSFIHLAMVSEVLADSAIKMGGQDVCAFGSTGAFTGDVSAVQLKSVGATFAIIGHSERRAYHGETHELIVKKLTQVMDSSLMAVLCVGETKAEYESGETLAVLDRQLSVLDGLQVDTQNLLIAYEPVWAIGTGLTPTIKEVASVHRHIKNRLGNQGVENVGVLYGGSVNDKNAAEFASCDLVDGALVGGASLKAESFAAIARAFG